MMVPQDGKEREEVVEEGEDRKDPHLIKGLSIKSPYLYLKLKLEGTLFAHAYHITCGTKPLIIPQATY